MERCLPPETEEVGLLSYELEVRMPSMSISTYFDPRYGLFTLEGHLWSFPGSQRGLERSRLERIRSEQ